MIKDPERYCAKGIVVFAEALIRQHHVDPEKTIEYVCKYLRKMKIE